MIESLEGKRGTPRIRPPFPVEQGYLGQPTIVNNVETFCAAAQIALRGGAWWAAIGTAHSSGTKLHSVSGDCERPGIYEYPSGRHGSAGAARLRRTQHPGGAGRRPVRACAWRRTSWSGASVSKTCPRQAP
ncbi:MAG: hypothetical protein V9G23_02615 [Giesbergeria sp.]